MRVPPPQPGPFVVKRTSTRSHDIVGWIGILAGTAVFVTAMAVPVDDATLAMAIDGAARRSPDPRR